METHPSKDDRFPPSIVSKGNLAGRSSSTLNCTRRASADLSIFPAPQTGSLLALPVNPTPRWGTLILVTLPVFLSQGHALLFPLFAYQFTPLVLLPHTR